VIFLPATSPAVFADVVACLYAPQNFITGGFKVDNFPVPSWISELVQEASNSAEQATRSAGRLLSCAPGDQ
jgi:hypothetical protein